MVGRVGDLCLQCRKRIALAQLLPHKVVLQANLKWKFSLLIRLTFHNRKFAESLNEFRCDKLDFTARYRFAKSVHRGDMAGDHIARLIKTLVHVHAHLEFWQTITLYLYCAWAGRVTHDGTDGVGAVVHLISQLKIRGKNSEAGSLPNLLEHLVALGVLYLNHRLAPCHRPQVGIGQGKRPDMDRLPRLIQGLIRGYHHLEGSHQRYGTRDAALLIAGNVCLYLILSFGKVVRHLFLNLGKPALVGGGIYHPHFIAIICSQADLHLSICDRFIIGIIADKYTKSCWRPGSQVFRRKQDHLLRLGAKVMHLICFQPDTQRQQNEH